MATRILLADDHAIVREGIRLVLERAGFEVVAEAADGQEALALTRQHQPDVAVVDVSMPHTNGLTATEEIRRACPDTRVILLTVHTEASYIVEGIRAGAAGYVLKTHAAHDLIRAIQEAVRGGNYVSPEVSLALLEACQRPANFDVVPLTARERQVLQAIAEGATTKEVARQLHISVKTADSHRTRIMQKLDLHQTAGLVRYAIRRGLIEA
jgi:two-component system response regulator NreC